MDRGDENNGAGDGEHEASQRPHDRTRSQAAAPPQDTPGGKLIQVTGSGLSGPFIRRAVMTVLLTLAVIVAGLATYNKIAVNDLPAVVSQIIQVAFSYPRADPRADANHLPKPPAPQHHP